MPPTTPTHLDEFLKLHPADLADRLQRLSLEEAQLLLPELPPALAARALGELEHERQQELLKALPAEKLAPLLSELPPNIVADLVPALPPRARRATLDALPAEHHQRVQALLRYAPDTAGGLMSDSFIALREDMTVEEARELLRAHAREERAEDVAYLYVTDARRCLAGIVSLRDLVFRRAERRIHVRLFAPPAERGAVEVLLEDLPRGFRRWEGQRAPPESHGRVVFQTVIIEAQG